MNPQSREILQAESPPSGGDRGHSSPLQHCPALPALLGTCLQYAGTAGTSLQPCFTLQLQTLRRFQTRFLNKHAWVREGLHHFHALKILFRPTRFSLQIFMKIQLHPSYNSSPSFKETPLTVQWFLFSYSPARSSKLQALACKVSPLASEFAPNAMKELLVSQRCQFRLLASSG